jgi:hypothetical protein
MGDTNRAIAETPMNMVTHTYIHTYMTFIHTYILYIHTNIHTYIHTYYVQVYIVFGLKIRTCIHRVIKTDIHTYIH